MSRLVDIADAIYQMQTWSAADACRCLVHGSPTRSGRHVDGCPYPTTTHSWVPMENGAAPARWKPKRDVREAVKQAATWAGAIWGIGMPAMQVVELPSGLVIWRDSARYPDVGAPVVPDWQAEVYAAARAAYAAERADLADTGRTPDRLHTGHQEVLF